MMMCSAERAQACSFRFRHGARCWNSGCNRTRSRVHCPVVLLSPSLLLLLLPQSRPPFTSSSSSLQGRRRGPAPARRRDHACRPRPREGEGRESLRVRKMEGGAFLQLKQTTAARNEYQQVTAAVMVSSWNLDHGHGHGHGHGHVSESTPVRNCPQWNHGSGHGHGLKGLGSFPPMSPFSFPCAPVSAICRRTTTWQGQATRANESRLSAEK